MTRVGNEVSAPTKPASVFGPRCWIPGSGVRAGLKLFVLAWGSCFSNWTMIQRHPWKTSIGIGHPQRPAKCKVMPFEAIKKGGQHACQQPLAMPVPAFPFPSPQSLPMTSTTPEGLARSNSNQIGQICHRPLASLQIFKPTP